MAKKAPKDREIALLGKDRERTTSPFFLTMQDRGRQEMGTTHRVCLGTEAEKAFVGLPLPYLSLRYLFHSTIYPLSRIVQIAGQEGSAKSAMLFEIAKWHFTNGGGFIFAENENKDAYELRHSLWEWRQPWIGSTQVVSCTCMEDWQEVISTYTRIAQEQYDDPKGVGRTVPVIIGVDSLTATLPRRLLEATQKDGFASLHHPVMARLISEFMRAIPAAIQDYPITIVGTNHLKPGQTPTGIPTANVPGGGSVKFMETYEIHMTRLKDIQRVDRCGPRDGLRVDFKMQKSSLGPSRRRLEAELLWYREDLPDGNWRQCTYWDWPAASTEVLLRGGRNQISKTTQTSRKEVREAIWATCDVHPITVGVHKEKAVWSKALGVSKDAPLSYHDFGVLLETRPDLLQEIHRLFDIQTRTPFAPGLAYQEQVAAAQAELDQAVARGEADA